MSAVQETFALLAAIDADPSQAIVPTRRDYRDDVRRAVVKAAAEHSGRVHIADVRPHIPKDVPPNLPGCVISALASSKHLHFTGEYRPNGGPSGNARKPAPVFELVRPIEGIAAA